MMVRWRIYFLDEYKWLYKGERITEAKINVYLFLTLTHQINPHENTIYIDGRDARIEGDATQGTLRCGLYQYAGHP